MMDSPGWADGAAWVGAGVGVMVVEGSGVALGAAPPNLEIVRLESTGDFSGSFVVKAPRSCRYRAGALTELPLCAIVLQALQVVPLAEVRD